MVDDRSRLLRMLLRRLRMKDYSNNYKVYGLINPISNTLFYIGCTKQHLAERLRQHYWDNSNNIKKDSLESLLNFKLIPKIYIFFESKNRIDARTMEAKLINLLSDNMLTVELLNSKRNINKIS